MALSVRAICLNNLHFRTLSKQIRPNVFSYRNNVRFLSCNIQCVQTSRPIPEVQYVNLSRTTNCRQFSVQNEPPKDSTSEPKPVKLSLVQRFKQMYKDYWYVLVPVHLATSAVWFGGFYYAVRSGLDVIAILESLNLSDKLLDPLRESRAGYFALAYAMYKLATPLRYSVTLGGTTYAIKTLVDFGLIKPVPSRERLKEIYQEKKDSMQDKRNLYQTKMQAKKTQVLDEVRRYKTEMRSLKDKVKKGM